MEKVYRGVFEVGVGEDGMVSQQLMMMTKELAARIVDFCAVKELLGCLAEGNLAAESFGPRPRAFRLLSPTR